MKVRAQERAQPYNPGSRILGTVPVRSSLFEGGLEPAVGALAGGGVVAEEGGFACLGSGCEEEVGVGAWDFEGFFTTARRAGHLATVFEVVSTGGSESMDTPVADNAGCAVVRGAVSELDGRSLAVDEAAGFVSWWGSAPLWFGRTTKK